MATVTEEITEFIFGWKWRSRTICAGAELGVFDHFDRIQPRHTDDVSGWRMCGSHYPENRLMGVVEGRVA